MKIYNPVASGKASGRALGGVFSFNRGMATFKRYVKPYNPNSPEQQAIKNRFSYLTKYWANSLTYEQITAWNEWVLPWTDIYGNPVTLTGINKFCIINDTLLVVGKALRLTPPNLTPSTLVTADNSEPGIFFYYITQVSHAEFIAQEPFIFIETIGFQYGGVGEPNYYELITNGLPISRTPLDKNYKFIDILQEPNPNTWSEEYIIAQTHIGHEILVALRLTRYNMQGNWSNSVVLVVPLTSA